MSIIEYLTDNQGVYNICNSFTISINSDLYLSILSGTIEKAIRLRVRWMPSHLKDGDDLPTGVSRKDIPGNRLADDLAGKTAKRFALPLHMTAPSLSE